MHLRCEGRLENGPWFKIAPNPVVIRFVEDMQREIKQELGVGDHAVISGELGVKAKYGDVLFSLLETTMTGRRLFEERSVNGMG